MNILRQSTAVDIGIGPFIDDDGITPATGLTITQAETRLKKNNGAWGQANDNTSATHEEEGWYEKELDATDTNTVGILIVAVYISGNLAWWTRFQVVEEAVYDALYAASATGNTAAVVSILSDTTHIHSDTTAIHTQTTTIASDVLSQFAVVEPYVSDIHSDTTAIHSQTTKVLSDTVLLTAPRDGAAGAYPELGIIDQGTAQSASATTLVLRAVTPFSSDDACNGAILLAHGSDQGYWQARTIDDYTTADDTATVSTWDVTPSGTITYKVFGTPPSTASSLTATQASQLTRIQSDVISQFAVVEPFVSDTYSDTTAIHSQTTRILSDTTAMHTQTTTIASDLLVLSVEISDIYSDTTLLVSDVASQFAVIEPFVSDIYSDTAAIHSQTTRVLSDTTAIHSDTTAVHSDTTAIHSDTTAVQTKTDSLTFTVANVVDANVQRINDVTITGDGAPGTEFGV